MEPASRALTYYILFQLDGRFDIIQWPHSLPPNASFPESFGLSALHKLIAIIRDPVEFLLINEVKT